MHRLVAGASAIANDFSVVIGVIARARNLHRGCVTCLRSPAMDETMDEVKSRVGDNFEQLREELSERTQEIRNAITDYVDEHPFQAVGIAFGVGYLLSGALFSRATFRAVSFGGKFVLGGFLKQLVAGIGPGLILAAISGRDGGGQAQQQSGAQGGGGNGNRG
jgi:DUF883 C-terminal glycine zipper region